jgi:hypothetical protein
MGNDGNIANVVTALFINVNHVSVIGERISIVKGAQPPAVV